MSKFRLSRRSEENLRGVHPDLAKVVHRALEITDIDFMVIEGKRNEARQRQLVASGKSQTMNSRHLTGHAVDCAPLVNNQIPWNDWSCFKKVADAMMQAAKEFGVDIEWGGNWKTFKDGPHFQLTHKTYPA
ncbi:M15 family metallopeptidase [Proteus mirabilis]|uniref:M15 family metallopeptidase n=1 Tax=Proteus TaxID=583 RepID=UPI0018A60D63|nr:MULTISPECIES: M15 family metallopeptidase [Proteus]MBS3857688.1 M15 family metallopeptidase [Proteus mirabilis]MCT0068585.1 M15 family metallopeptidase [Proteus mirabilis]MCW9724658.1 M15 family metallopeptidase [Proteus mirabilis]MDF7422927.1 M15 family metallopeptidase [Proteus mirabilis]MDF7482642.1 M15 family metallopeptidase [Proteus mirabilis]